MAWPSIFGSLFRSSRSAQSANYARTIPLRRLTYLLLAIFCMFGMVGCFVDLLTLGQRPLPIVLTWSMFSGAIAAAAALIGFRTPRYLWIVLIVWALGSRLISELLHRFGSQLARPTIEDGVRAATIACIILSLAAYIFFMQFISSVGRHAVRMQTELALPRVSSRPSFRSSTCDQPASKSMASLYQAPRWAATWSMSCLSLTALSSPTLPTSPATASPPESSWA